MKDQCITMKPLSNPVRVPLKPSTSRDLLFFEPANDDVSGKGSRRTLPDVTALKGK